MQTGYKAVTPGIGTAKCHGLWLMCGGPSPTGSRIAPAKPRKPKKQYGAQHPNGSPLPTINQHGGAYLDRWVYDEMGYERSLDSGSYRRPPESN
jgi:hypothetical protein